MHVVTLALASLTWTGHVASVQPEGQHHIRKFFERTLLEAGENATDGFRSYAKLLLALGGIAPSRKTMPFKQHDSSSSGYSLGDVAVLGTRSAWPLYRKSRGYRRSRYAKPRMANFDMFSKSAIETVMRAQEEATRMKQEMTEEMILLGLIRHPTGGGSEVLRKCNLTHRALREYFDERIGVGNKEFDFASRIPLTQGCKAVLQWSFDEATKRGTQYVETEHLAYAVLADSAGLCTRALKDLGVDVDEVKRLLVEKMNSNSKDVALVGGGGSGGATTQAKTETLEKYGTDLTKKAEEGLLDPVIGRDVEVQNAIEILGQRKKNNPVFIGEPGVGKTAIAEGIAQKIADGKVEFLKGKRLIELDLAALLAGTRFRGEFEERLQNIIEEVVASNRNIILMIDEIHTIVKAGGTEGALDAGNIMKPKLASGDLQVIGATTLDEYRQYIEKDKALERRFSPVMVPEPSVEQTIEILKGIVFKYEEYHELTYTPEAIEACATLADQYIADRFLPDKAIEVLDMAGAAAKIRHDEVVESSSALPVVSETNVTQIISKRTGIPVNKVTTNESARLLGLEDILHGRVIGQHEAIVAVSKAVRRARSGLKDPNRPVASFVFAGPTGVGKTELCKALSRTYYGNEKSMLRFDMSEYMEKHAISKLIGSPPGYVGYDEESQLCDRIRRNPYSLVVFDEIEKAHPDVFNIMLQILDDGRLTDSKGRVVSFKNALIVLTSNVGAQNIEKAIEGGGGFGFAVSGANQDEATYDNLKAGLMEELKTRFKPEFLNRLDDTIVFRPLTLEDVRKIAELEFEKVFKRVEEQYSSTVQLTGKFKDKVLEEGFDAKFGARPLRRAVSRLLEDELAASTLAESFRPGDVITVDVDEDGRVVVRRQLDMIKAQFEPFFA